MSLKIIILRLKICWNVLFGKYKHYLLINIDKPNLIKLLEDEPFQIDGFHCGLQPYTYFKIIKSLAATKDDIDMVLDKAQFEADAIVHSKNK
jgi:hypothetical protein